MVEEKYIIGDREFVLREDLSFEELERVEQFTNPFNAEDKKTISGGRNYKKEEVIELVKMLLAPIDKSSKENFDWKKLTPEQSVVIVADYLKKKVQENIIINRSLQILKNEHQMQLKHTTT